MGTTARRLLLSGSLLFMFASGTAGAQSVTDDYTLVSFPGTVDGTATSTAAGCTLGLCSVYHEFKLTELLDGNLRLVWTSDVNGGVIVSGLIPWVYPPERNTSVGRSAGIEWAGFIAPSFTVSDGTIDFRESIGFNVVNPTPLSRPCSAPFQGACDQDFVDPFFELPNPIPTFSPPPPPGQGARAPEQESLAPLRTALTLGDVESDPNGPPGATTSQDVILFMSEAGRQDSSYRYRYTVTSFLDDAVDFVWEEVGWAGTVNAGDSLTLDFVTTNAPRLSSSAPSAELAPGESFAASFQILQPIPEPGTILTVLAGLTGLAVRRRSRKFASRETAGEPSSLAT